MKLGAGRGGSGLGVDDSLVGLGGIGVGARFWKSFEGLGLLERRTREAKRACVTVLWLGGESDIRDGAVTARRISCSFERGFVGSADFWGEVYWADVGLGSLGRNKA